MGKKKHGEKHTDDDDIFRMHRRAFPKTDQQTLRGLDLVAWEPRNLKSLVQRKVLGLVSHRLSSPSLNVTGTQASSIFFIFTSFFQKKNKF